MFCPLLNHSRYSPITHQCGAVQYPRSPPTPPGVFGAGWNCAAPYGPGIGYIGPGGGPNPPTGPSPSGSFAGPTFIGGMMVGAGANPAFPGIALLGNPPK